jgi:signal transduction histidine kinase
VRAIFHPHIFEKFYRVEIDDTSDVVGTGLELAIAKSIFEVHGGRVSGQRANQEWGAL